MPLYQVDISRHSTVEKAIRSARIGKKQGFICFITANAIGTQKKVYSVVYCSDKPHYPIYPVFWRCIQDKKLWYA